MGSRSETLDVMGADGERWILFKSSFTFMLDGVANVGLKIFESHRLTDHLSQCLFKSHHTCATEVVSPQPSIS